MFEFREGETPFDLSGLRLSDVKTREQLDAAEFENNALAVLKYLAARPSKRLAPFDFTWMLKLHQEMFGVVWDWAGNIRSENLSLGIPFYQIPAHLDQLVENLRVWEQFEPSALTRAARMHVEAVKIHPFQNGNGRWSRLLSNIYLKQCGAKITEWPADLSRVESPIRGEYIAAIKAAINEGDESLILELHAKFTR
jgi:fido (protein-threonine AMPylation protein)